jgi:hypothetical protein
MAESLRASDLALDTTDYMITDDASTEYSAFDLQALFPWASIVRHNAKWHHPLLNTHFCFQEFLNGTYQYLVILDSDMIVSKDWRSRLDALIALPDFKIGSLYNSASHPINSELETHFIKDTAGFAGMVFSRETIASLKSRIGHAFDDWTVCRDVGTIFKVCKPSAVAHIGIKGQWNGSNYNDIDKARDFDWSSVSPETKKACEELLKVTF